MKKKLQKNEIVAEQEKKKQPEKLLSWNINPGMKIWEISMIDGSVKEGEFKEVAIEPIYAAPDKKGNKKVVTTKRRLKLIIKEEHYYVPAINITNALIKFTKIFPEAAAHYYTLFVKYD